VCIHTTVAAQNTEALKWSFKGRLRHPAGINIVDVVDIKGDTTVAFDRSPAIAGSHTGARGSMPLSVSIRLGQLVADAVKRSGDNTRVWWRWDVNPDTLNGIKDGTIDSPRSVQSPSRWLHRPQGAGRSIMIRHAVPVRL